MLLVLLIVISMIAGALKLIAYRSISYFKVGCFYLASVFIDLALIWYVLYKVV